MKCRVLGKKQTKFVDKETGELKEFAKIYCSHRLPADNQATTFEGQGCSEISIPIDHYGTIPIDGDIELDFDANGKLLEIIVD